MEIKNNCDVTKMISDVKNSLKQKSASTKDEINIMKAMLNDTNYKVSTYNNSGVVSQHCPAEDFRNIVSEAIVSTTKISKAEADSLANNYEVKKTTAESMVSLSKDFMNTYLRTGRKINMGGTEKSNISLQLREIKESTKSFPKAIGTDSAGNTIYERANKLVPAHEGLKVTSPCPSWLTKTNK